LKIKSKKEIEYFLDQFPQYAEWDQEGKKHYYCFVEKETDYVVTLMKYENDTFTIHRRNDQWYEELESEIPKQEIVKLIWNHRGIINKQIEG